jgi:hypothetical protein
MEEMVGPGVYIREGTTSTAMVADRPYGEFYYFYSFCPEYFGHTLVHGEVSVTQFVTNLAAGM